MLLNKLHIENFRNIQQATLHLSEHYNFISGSNGAGKTSLLEAVAFLARGKSFRTRHISSLIHQDSDYFQLIGQVGQGQTVGLRRTRQDIIVRLNGQTINKLSQLAKLFPLLVITPKTHELIERGPEFRRHFIDWGLFHVEHYYSVMMQEYRRALKQHNAALSLPDKQLAVWKPALINAAKKIDSKRRNLIATLEPLFAQTVDQFTGIKSVTLDYSSGWKRNTEYAQQLEEKSKLDKERGYTSVGPHRADLIVKVNGVTARERLSRGQQKIVVSALVIAQAKLISRHQPPILLIDDLPSELDSTHQKLLFSILSDIPSQKIITTIDPDVAKGIPDKAMFHVEHGMLKE